MDKKQSLQYDPAAHDAMNWYGWGSPIGLGLFAISAGVTLWLLHLAHIIR